ncbi:MAG TPA: hypothetical protein VM537_31260 [Anaerolineae bacterium]|nr:hypothetical protein [Anaerolineae bacterium]
MTIGKRLRLLLILLILPLILPADSIPAHLVLDLQVSAVVSGHRFNLTLWEAGALSAKVRDTIKRPASELDDVAARELVEDYVAAARRIAELEDRIARLLSEPEQSDAGSAILLLQHELDGLQKDQDARRPVVEAVLERQTAGVVAQEQLTVLGLVWPPLKFHFSDPPLYLVISPRQRIALRMGLHLDAELSLPDRQEIEGSADRRLSGYVSLVEDIGGFGAYPTMVIDRASLPWILDTIAHEWTHNYLAFRPLGWHYFDNPDTVTLNETVASIVGEEIGARVMETHYLQPSPPRPSISERRPQTAAQPDLTTFDFSAEMRRTRLRVDTLLEAGLVAEAEAYMEEQRLRFVGEGYELRKLNQAYFAFHGSYATAPSAVDPIGPKMTELRQASGSLREFLDTVSGFTAVEDLDAALQAVGR